MKRFIIFVSAMVAVMSAAAQGVVVVDSEQIFKSVAEYNVALAEVEALNKSYQAEVDAKFAAVETLFNNYATQKAMMTPTQQRQREMSILERESEATALQKGYFGENGALMKRRLELIAPIQARVFGAIDDYAKRAKADVVIDKSSNPSLLYIANGVDRSAEIIEILKR